MGSDTTVPADQSSRSTHRNTLICSMIWAVGVRLNPFKIGVCKWVDMRTAEYECLV